MRPPDRFIENALIDWLPRQRWFAGKGLEIDGVRTVSATEIVPGEPGLRHTLIEVRQDAGADRYQLLLGWRSEQPERLRYAEIAADGGKGHVYDAVHDPELTRVLLDGIAREATIGPLRFRRAAGAEIETDLVSLASPAEQSNTSLVFGDQYILKLFRRVTPGANPDLELNLALTEAGCEHIPRLFGWVETDLDGEPTPLAIMSEYLRTASDGWQLATTSVRDLYGSAELAPEEAGGDFAGEAERLGAATAVVHRDLAEAFGVGELGPDEVRAMARRMAGQLDEACADTPELAPYAETIAAAFKELAELGQAMPVQRIHGDFHLGQVMRTERGWVLLDFEGEPARSLAERRAPGHPLRDVAGMLRSFEYAARFLLGGHRSVAPELTGVLEGRARQWADRNRAAFCRGYAAAGGPDPAAQHVLVRAFELDKAVYEVRYEARNRPGWLHVPLGSLDHLLNGRDVPFAGTSEQ